MDNLDNQIKVCPTCQGWGREEREEHASCKSCGGKGVFIQTGSGNLSFELPTFIDFGARRKHRLIRIFSLVLISIFGLLFLGVLIYVIILIF